MKKLLSLILFVAFLSGCGGPDIQGKYTAQTSALFMTLNFTIEFLEADKAIIYFPKMGPKEASTRNLNYRYEDDTVSLWEKGTDDQIVMKVEEKGKILRLVSGVSGFPEVWTKTVTP